MSDELLRTRITLSDAAYDRVVEMIAQPKPPGPGMGAILASLPRKSRATPRQRIPALAGGGRRRRAWVRRRLDPDAPNEKGPFARELRHTPQYRQRRRRMNRAYSDPGFQAEQRRMCRLMAFNRSTAGTEWSDDEARDVEPVRDAVGPVPTAAEQVMIARMADWEKANWEELQASLRLQAD